MLLAAAKGMELPVVELTAENVREQRKQIEFDAAFGGERLKGLTVSLCGRHQADNACAALGALLALKKKGMKIPTSAVRAGLADVHWPGRLEYFGHVLLDGAHNDPGVRALCGYLDKWMPKENTVLISAMMRDKETEKMCQRLAPRVRCVVCTQPNIPRAMPAEELARAFEAQGLRAYARTHVKRRAGRGAPPGWAGRQCGLRGFALSDRRNAHLAEKGTGKRWDSVPNPARNLRFLDFPPKRLI